MKKSVMIAVLLLTGLVVFAQTGDRTIDLFRAVWTGDAETVERLLACTPDPNLAIVFGEDETTLIHAAAAADQSDMVTLLVEHGANPNLTDCAGNTPLLVAAVLGGCETVKALITAGCDPCACHRSTGLTPIELADMSGNEAVVRLLSVVRL